MRYIVFMSSKNQFFFGAALVVCFICALLVQPHARKAFETSQKESEIYYLPSSGWLQAFCMGYNEALASALWVKFILYFATSSKKAVPDKSQATELPNPKVIASGDKNNSVDYIQAVTSLDTHFHAAYLHGARLTLYHKGIISRETVEMSAAILQKGLQYFPADGELMFHLGFLYYYEMLPFVKNETEKRKFKRKGTMIIQKASNMSNAPGYASMLASGLLEKEGMDELVIQHLQAMLVQEQPPEIRDNLTRELSVLLDDQAQKDFLKYNELYDRWQKDMNFIPFDLFMILAP